VHSFLLVSELYDEQASNFSGSSELFMDGVEIVNASGMNSYMITRQVESSLMWIPKADLEGLKVIRCIDQIDLQDQSARNEQQKVHPHGYDITGMYYRERGEFPATIELYVGAIYRDIPGFLMYSSIPVLRLTETLAHEVGHHIAARGVASSFLNFRFSHKTDEEEFAEEHARRIQGRMLNNSKVTGEQKSAGIRVTDL